VIAAVRPVRQAQQEDPARDPDSIAGIDDPAAWPTPSPRTCRSSSSQAGSAGSVRASAGSGSTAARAARIEVDILQVEKRIRGRVKRQMEKSQREYYLNEQVKAIQKELGEGEEGADLEELEKKIKAAGMSKEGAQEGQSELKKLKLMSPMSAEATVVRNYIETLVGLPWRKKTRKIKQRPARTPKRC
jgi:hypothetical protein